MTDPSKFHDALNDACLEYAAFSCDGVDLFGDSKSIGALRQWHHEAGIVPALKDEIKRLRSQWVGMKNEVNLCHARLAKVADLAAPFALSAGKSQS